MTVSGNLGIDVPAGTLGSIWKQAGLKKPEGDDMEYVVIVEQGETSVGAYAPDLPGCVAVGQSRDEAMQRIREAIELHIESLREYGETVPLPHAFVERVAV